MTAYYPSQGGYPASQPVAMGHPYGVAHSYGGVPVGGMSYVPSHPASHHSHRRRRRYSYPSHHYGYGHSMPGQVVSGVPTAVSAPVGMQPYGGYYDPYSWGNRFRRFFGLAPSANVRYKHDRSTWGFMGYSRRQRYIDARTGGEVDRRGRPVYRV